MLKGLALGNRGNKLTLILALLLGLLAAVLIAVYLSSAGNESSTGASTVASVPVVVAARDIAAGTRIEAGMVSVKPVPTDVVILKGFKKSEEVVGKVASINILSGEQIVSDRVVATSEAGQVLEAAALAETVPLAKEATPCKTGNCGLRAVSVSVAPATAAAGLIRPGDRVDVIAAFEDGSAVTVVTDVEVLALDQDFKRVVSGESKDASAQAVLKEGEKNPEAATATLALWPDEAQKVAAAEEMTDKNKNCQGSIRLSLRHTGEPGTFAVPLGRGYCAQLFALAWGLDVAPVPAQLVPKN